MKKDELTDQDVPEKHPTVPEPLAHLQSRSLGEWARTNLFPDLKNTISTIVFGTLLLAVALAALRFVFISGRWEILLTNTTNVLVGLFPREDVPLAWVALFIMTPGVGLMVGSAHQLVTQSDEDEGVLAASMGRQVLDSMRRFAPLIVLVLLFVYMARGMRPLAAGLVLGLAVLVWAARTLGMRLPRQRATTGVGLGLLIIIGGIIFLNMNVGWDEWGGLLLTMFVATASIVLCFPFGVLAALGRRSKLPVMRAVSVGYIELIRGVPLITLLFVASLMLGLFLPQNLQPTLVTRAIIMITLFSGAYVAEIVRGGLQAVPKGQSEAARALGLSPVKETRLIVLPQALRNVIPALVGQFISLFKDTSLLIIIGLRELLGITQVLTKQQEFNGRGLEAEVLFYAAFVYWVIAFTMSRESQRLETRLGIGSNSH